MPNRAVFLDTMNNINTTYNNDVVGNNALQAAAKKEEMERRWDVTKFLSRRLVRVAKEMLPSTEYVPTYMLYENVVEGDDGLVMSIISSSPTWLLNMVSAGVRAKDWRLTTSERGLAPSAMRTMPATK
ncbi:MAG: hypothetical protein Q9194_004451 [Teloschistes cf. exilis]